MDSESSSEEQSSTECSTDSSDDDEKLETAQVCGVRIQLPQGLCERKDIFNEFFSASTWNLLSEEHKQHLNSFLPTFPENDEHEKSVTLSKLFNNEIFRFTSPLAQFHEHLKAGHYRPDIAKMRLLIRKAERKEAKYRHKLYRERLKEDITESKNKLLNLVKNLPPGVEPRMEKLSSTTPSYVNPISFRTKRRYFQELSSLREKVDETGFSSDENYPEGPPTPLSRKQKRHLNAIKNSALNNERVVSTLATKPNVLELERLITPNCNPFFISEDSYRNLLSTHKRRRLEDANNPEYVTNGIGIMDIINRTDLTSFRRINNVNSIKHHMDHKPSPHKKKIKKEPLLMPNSPEIINKSNPFFGHSSNSELDSDSEPFYDSVSSLVTPNSKLKLKKPLTTIKPIKKEIKVEPVDTYLSASSAETKPLPVDDISPKSLNCVMQYGKVTPATLSDLDGIDMMNLPIDLDDSNIEILEFNNKPELMQDTHANFLSLIRDIICSTNEHRMTMKALEERLRTWQANPISALNDWYNFSDNWVLLLPKAVNFLSGNFSEQPEDFVPYIEFKEKLEMYQWIGAGRDSDSLLSPLCQYWLEHRNQMKPALLVKPKEEDVEVSDRSQTPPPPRCPTTWSIRKANSEEIKSFQEQERRRYSNPHKAFTYRCNGYESVVGPVKGVYNNQNVGSTKARGHSVLNADRPNYVTILTLVRDATARLPNGEGTRADICELLKSSQYLSTNVPDNVLQSVVSGALDRMHTQFDPCVKYESKRKVWIYLHRNRSEEDFERIHHQYQGVSKTLKKAVPKSKPVSKPRSKHDKVVKQKSPESQVVSDKTKAEVMNTVEQYPNPNDRLTSVINSKQSAISNKANLPNNTTTCLEKAISSQRKISANPQSSAPKSPAKYLQTQVPPLSLPEKHINEGVAVKRTASPNAAKNSNKSLVKIIASNQGKSLILPTASPQLLKQIESKSSTVKQTPQPVSQQILQTIAQQKQLLLQKQNAQMAEQKMNETKVQHRVPISVQQQLLQSVTPQLQAIKATTVIKANSPTPNVIPSTCSVIQSSALQAKEIVVTTSQQPVVIQDQVIQTGIQNKVAQPRLTPAQQQQILQSLKQKALPLQQTVMSSQYRAVSKIQKPSTSPLVQGQAKVITSDGLSPKPIMATSQAPLVAKVLTNAAGQVISVESLLAHQKQHGSLPQGTTLRISGTKAGQSNLIQLSTTNAQNSVAQFSVATSSIASYTNQPKLIISTPVTTLATSTVTVAKPSTKANTKTQIPAKLIPKLAQQLVNAKFVAQGIGGQKLVQPKVIVGSSQNSLKVPISNKNLASTKSVGINVMANTNAIRMVNAANINLAQLGGKPLLITSKGSTFQNIQGQNIIIQTQANSNAPGVIISNTEKTTPGVCQQNSGGIVSVSNQQNAQVILSPALKVQQGSQVMLSNQLKPTTVSIQQNSNASPGQIVLGGQTVRLQTGATPNTHRVVLASQNQSQIITQQILLPVGFQGTPLNIKTLQGLKVVPIAQTQGGRGGPGRPVFARVVNPAGYVRMAQAAENPDLSTTSKTTAD
ncbi:hypothetical protein PPYR_07287 [Photinus pyralis]|uniref:DEUBAD domain-containing protein n=1 Tax=Photinus pyralis TaxID=7054 RepID=A0A5N4AQ01_PHOPY|nr:nuclear factor related to kappa-B-binding protein-like isoform X1 [Photinus pyralis]XP_031338789.1 nuclear factor related to kappa-B-binding protein-like isoform X1 [Photinus pyralis]KAB0799407.1 hypothetical protein PPYR_07287 [Photinus pyralis]